jgi:tripartite-type tricarboxylate transporter receptor subunit TctC
MLHGRKLRGVGTTRLHARHFHWRRQLMSFPGFQSRLVALVLALGLVFGFGFGFAAPASAQVDYPVRPITLIVPFPAGGSTDVLVRALARELQERLGQTVVLEFKPGASGILGAAQMVGAKPDGYTLTMLPISAIRQYILGKVQYDPFADLTYIASVANYPLVIAVPTAAPWKTMRELVSDVKANPGKFSFAGGTPYSNNHLTLVELGRREGLDWTYVPFKGDADAIIAVLGGHVHLFSVSSPIVQHIEAGKLRALAVGGLEPLPDYPGVPTLKDAGFDIQMVSPLGVAGPANLPAGIVDKLDRAIRDALEDPEFLRQVPQGMQVAYRDHEAYASWARKTYEDEKVLIDRLKQ